MFRLPANANTTSFRPSAHCADSCDWWSVESVLACRGHNLSAGIPSLTRTEWSASACRLDRGICRTPNSQSSSSNTIRCTFRRSPYIVRRRVAVVWQCPPRAARDRCRRAPVYRFLSPRKRSDSTGIRRRCPRTWCPVRWWLVLHWPMRFRRCELGVICNAGFETLWNNCFLTTWRTDEWRVLRSLVGWPDCDCGRYARAAPQSAGWRNWAAYRTRTTYRINKLFKN